ncbi:hypothetical protein [Cellulophaga fucicola]|uniref:hypothetical protein n=1 Tax=Cellulophaga fucicola TaxID=76595 RepID=UPI003EBDE03E
MKKNNRNNWLVLQMPQLENLRVKSILLGVLAVGFISCSSNSLEEPSLGEETSGVLNEEEALVLNEGDFYTPPTTYAVTKDFVADYGADKVFDTDDSEKLQSAIDDVSSKGGGKLIIPEGNYSFSEIKMKSNVHIIVNSEAVIRPSERTDTKNFIIFTFGKESAVVKNVSISSSNGDKFTVDLTKSVNTNVAVFNFNNVNNFLIADFLVKDNLTKFSAVTMGITKYNEEYYSPRNGVVKNGNTLNSDYGYGLVQVQAAKNVFYKDLKGTGGVTLRFETGLNSMNDLQIGGVYDMFGENISCTNGNAAVMISPHAMHNGDVYVNGITAVSCGFGARIESGFISKNYTNPDLTKGTFTKVTISNVNATYGESKAQLKPKHYKFMPCSLRNLIDTNPIATDGDSYWGPSMSAVLNAPNYDVVLDENKVVGTGFKEGYVIVTDEDAINDNDCN